MKKKPAMKMKKAAPAKMGHKKSPTKFTPELRAAKAAGKLDDNPKFKAAVKMKKAAMKLKKEEGAAMKMKKAAMKLKKDSAMMMKKAAMKMKKVSAMKMKMKKK